MLSRREWIGRLLALAGVAALAPADMAVAAGKVGKAAAKYQDTPKNGQMCGTCKFYIPPGGRAGDGMMGGRMMGEGMMGGRMGPGMMAAGTCQVVEGRVSPHGWCILYAPIPG